MTGIELSITFEQILASRLRCFINNAVGSFRVMSVNFHKSTKTNNRNSSHTYSTHIIEYGITRDSFVR